MNWHSLLNLLTNTKRIYIYGAGKAGILTYLFLNDKGIDVQGFFESKPARKSIYSLGKTIFIWGDKVPEKDAVIILAITGNNGNEVENNINTAWKYIRISDEMFIKLYPHYQKRIEDILELETIVLYSGSGVEKNIYLNEFKDLFENRSILEKKTKELCKGMNDDDCIIIQNVLNRIQDLIYGRKGEDIFNDLEKSEIRKWKDKRKQIKCITKDDWELDGLHLPINDFRSEMFYDNLGYSVVQNKEKCRNKDIIDVGGYIGDSALILSQYTKGNVYVFEPVEKYFNYIEQTAKLNNAKLIGVYKAVSNMNGKAKYHMGEEKFNSTISTIEGRKYCNEILVDTITLDTFVEREQIEVGILKVHAEGAEQLVLQGAKKFIKSQRPVIIIEINHKASDFFDIKGLIKSINPSYNFRIYKPSNGFICLGLKLIAEIKDV